MSARFGEIAMRMDIANHMGRSRGVTRFTHKSKQIEKQEVYIPTFLHSDLDDTHMDRVLQCCA